MKAITYEDIFGNDITTVDTIYNNGLYDGAYLIQQFINMPAQDKLAYFGTSSYQIAIKQYLLEDIIEIMQEYLEEKESELNPGHIIKSGADLIYITAIQPSTDLGIDFWHGITQDGAVKTGIVHNELEVVGFEEGPAAALLEMFEDYSDTDIDEIEIEEEE